MSIAFRSKITVFGSLLAAVILPALLEMSTLIALAYAIHFSSAYLSLVIVPDLLNYFLQKYYQERRTLIKSRILKSESLSSVKNKMAELKTIFNHNNIAIITLDIFCMLISIIVFCFLISYYNSGLLVIALLTFIPFTLFELLILMFSKYPYIPFYKKFLNSNNRLSLVKLISFALLICLHIACYLLVLCLSSPTH